MLATYNDYKKKHPRITYHLILAGISLAGVIIAALFAAPTQSFLETLSIGTGYVGLVLLAVTLLIGPLNMLKVRKNPVNLNFRRDAGIWAGITSLAHVVFAFAVELNWGSTLLGFFLYKDGSPKFNLFGVSNYIGLFAALVLIFLLVLSNNHFLKALKGKRWKNMQRFNYLLFGLALLHTFTQQVNNLRGVLMIVGVIGVTTAVMIAQFIGFVVYRRRDQQRKVGAPVAKPAPVKGPVAIGQTLTPARITVQPAQGANGLARLKIASAVSLVAMLGVGVGLESISLMNNPSAALSSSLLSSEKAPVATGTATSTTAAATPTATTTTPAATPTAITPAASTTVASTTAASTTTAATTTQAATATATVSQPASNASPVHTGRS